MDEMVINLLAIKIECDERLSSFLLTSEPILTLKLKELEEKSWGLLEGQSSQCNLVCFGSIDIEVSFYLFQDLELFCIVLFVELLKI